MILNTPRQQHYVFAHAMLPRLLLDDPEKFVAILASQEAEDFLAYLWRRAGEEANDAQPVEPEGLGRTVEKLAEGIAVLVRMPCPLAITEAYFGAVIMRQGKKGLFRRATPQIRYFTLELGVTDDGCPRTVLCEWNKDGHVNYGDGPSPDPGQFLEAILNIW